MLLSGQWLSCTRRERARQDDDRGEGLMDYCSIFRFVHLMLARWQTAACYTAAARAS